MIDQKETFEQTIERIKKDNEEVVKCLEIAQEFDKMCTESPEVIRNIFLEGTRTEFWKYFKACVVRQMYLVDQNLRNKKVKNLEDMLLYNENRMIYQEADKWINFPASLLKALFNQFKANATKENTNKP